MNSLVEFIRHAGRISSLDHFDIIAVSETRKIFGESEAKPILIELREVAADAFGVESELKSMDGIRDHVMNVDVCLLACDDNNILGFASARIFSKFSLCYLHGIAVKNTEQQRGIGTKLLEFLMQYYSKLGRVALCTPPVMASDSAAIC